MKLGGMVVIQCSVEWNNHTAAGSTGFRITGIPYDSYSFASSAPAILRVNNENRQVWVSNAGTRLEVYTLPATGQFIETPLEAKGYLQFSLIYGTPYP